MFPLISVTLVDHHQLLSSSSQIQTSGSVLVRFPRRNGSWRHHWVLLWLAQQSHQEEEEEADTDSRPQGPDGLWGLRPQDEGRPLRRERYLQSSSYAPRIFYEPSNQYIAVSHDYMYEPVDQALNRSTWTWSSRRWRWRGTWTPRRCWRLLSRRRRRWSRGRTFRILWWLTRTCHMLTTRRHPRIMSGLSRIRSPSQRPH